MRRTRNPGSATKAASLVGATGNGAPPAAEIMSVDEVVARYDDEWILLRITAWDEDGWPSHGEVLAHSPDHDYIWDVTGNRPPDPATGEQHYIFQAHPTVRTGAEMMEALKTTWERDDRRLENILSLFGRQSPLQTTVESMLDRRDQSMFPAVEDE